MKSQSDIRKIVKANSVLNIATQGEFVFYKQGSAALRVIVHNDPVEMEPGDIRKFHGNTFDEFEIHNETGVDQQVVFTVGFGEYNRLVVRGDISSFESIIGVDGVARPDTRRKNAFVFGFTEPGKADRNGFFVTDTVAPIVTPAANVIDSTTDSNGNLIVLLDQGNENNLQLFDKNSGALLKTASCEAKPISVATHPTKGNVLVHGWPDDGWVMYSVLNDDLTVNTLSDQLKEESYFSYWPSGKELLFTKWGDLSVWSDQGVKLGEYSTSQIADTYGIGGNCKVIADPENESRIYAFEAETDGVATLYHIDLETGSLLGTYSAEYWQFISSEFNYLMNRWEAGLGSQDQSQRVVLEKQSGSIFGSGRVQLASEQNLLGASHKFQLVNNNAEKYSYDESTGIFKADAIFQTLAGFYARYNKKVPSNYMDYIHALAINGREILNTGSTSFARADINDFFEIKNGDVISITHSKELEPSIND